VPTWCSSISRARSHRWKPGARDKIGELDWGETVLCVRVNVGHRVDACDVIAIVEGAGERLDELMLPKVQSAAEVQALDMPDADRGRPPIASRVGTKRRSNCAGPHQRRGDLCRERPARDHHLRPGRLAASTEMPV
jgi:citrate lyase subunit beta/citryl-CoA lyase